MSLLEIDDVTISYGSVVAVRGVQLSVASGELLALLGPNGAGKTSLISAIAGLIKPKSGSIRFGDEPITGIAAHRLASRGLRLVPENRALFPHMTTSENLRLGAGRMTRREFAQTIDDILETFPVLGERRSQLAGTLSGGEQQMLSIARALIAGPELLILDEPSMGLAPKVVSEIMSTLGRLRDRGLAVLVAEQNARAVLPVADAAVLMVRGRITLSGAPDAIEERLSSDGYLGAGSSSSTSSG